MVLHFDDLPIGSKFTLTRSSTKSYEKIEDFYYERNGNVYNETNNCRVYPLPTPAELNKRKLAARARYDAMTSVGMKRTPYGWE